MAKVSNMYDRSLHHVLTGMDAVREAMRLERQLHSLSSVTCGTIDPEQAIAGTGGTFAALSAERDDQRQQPHSALRRTPDVR